MIVEINKNDFISKVFKSLLTKLNNFPTFADFMAKDVSLLTF